MLRIARPLRRRIMRVARTGRRAAEIALIEHRYTLPEPLCRLPDDHAALEEGHNAYWPSPWRLLTRMLPPAEVGPSDVFIDFGCGKGRVLLEAAEHYPFRKVIGVESEPHLAEAARALLSENSAWFAHRQWDVVTADVVDYEIPDDLTVAYLFDPFTGPVFDAVIAGLERSVDRNPRRVRIVYLVPKEMERLTRSKRIRPVRRGRAGWLRSGARMEYFVCDLLPNGER
jgi:SAM-dependent methyltransferase